MGVQMMGSHTNGLQSHHFQSLPRRNSWCDLTLDQVQSHLGDLGKPLGSMNLEELLKSVWAVEESTRMDVEDGSPASPLQRQARLNLARTFSGKTVDEVWKDIRQSQKGLNMEGELTLGETKLKNFFDKVGSFVADSSIEDVMVPDNASTPQNVTPQVGLSTSTSIDALSDTPMPGRKRGPVDFEKTLERRLKRKIKNRESAARSRARKQAYHNELVSKVSHLEMKNMKLKKEKELDKLLSNHLSTEPRYQLRRTSSF
ncbi:hypothetical protein Leryth_004932 [Lithospermum erythrorhizon]|nr:hypothetical protein Leryth_004932 [Lithospermum erythrorhizon]